MRKSEIKFICVVMAIAVFISTLTACSIGGNGGGGVVETPEIVVDNTGANTVSPYDTNGAYSLNIDAGDEIHDISDLLFGAFFEDINFGADGGLYAEMVKNRSFEFPQSLMGWKSFGNVKLKEQGSPFDRNPHYVSLMPSGHAHKHTGLENEGFRGMGFHQDSLYRFSVWAPCPHLLRIFYHNSHHFARLILDFF